MNQIKEDKENNKYSLNDGSERFTAPWLRTNSNSNKKINYNS